MYSERQKYRQTVENMSRPDPELLLDLDRKGVRLPWYLEIGNNISRSHKGNIRRTRLW
jgi:hypothetical protein